MTVHPDWVTISSLATAAGTMVLAIATFSAVRSANRAARAAEQSLLVNLRPVLMPSRRGDEEQSVMFADQHWVKLPGGGAAAEITPEAIYLALSLLNVGSGMAVLDGWTVDAGLLLSDVPPPEIDEFRRLTRDLYVAPGGVGFWQGALREPGTPGFETARQAIENRTFLTVHLLYGDFEGGQRTITRFSLVPKESGWKGTVARHWYVDRAGPRGSG